MADEPFIMLSLKEDKAKKLANVLTNKSASKILSHLAKHDGATETEIAEALKLPLSTVNYNMKAMVEAKLVTAPEYHYSSRGKEVNHYSLARKYIIIAPDDEQGFWDKIKKYVPIAAVAAVTGIIVKTLNILAPTAGKQATDSAMIGEGVEIMAMRAMDDSMVMAQETVAEPSFLQLLFGDWLGPFLLGVFVFLLLAMLVEGLRKK